ncbi:MAG: MmcQ/YjbR family DNA-binding protein [Planctomycetia bacterium]|nr:MmcQ/YjbR family DNA-binding protein [Planctomycetia bacterium]
MTANEFRKMALKLPDVQESAHMDHPDFRYVNKIFASLGTQESYGMVNLTSEQQKEFLASHPEAFEPCAGVWGKRGYTKVILENADKAAVKEALELAWKKVASTIRPSSKRKK